MLNFNTPRRRSCQTRETETCHIHDMHTLWETESETNTSLSSIAFCGCRFVQLSEVEIRHPEDTDQVNQDLSKLVNTETRIILLFAHE